MSTQPLDSTQLFASVFTASRLHAQVSVGRLGYRVTNGWDISSFFGLFGEEDVDAHWDFNNPAHDLFSERACYGNLVVNAWGCCEGYLPIPSPTTHALRELLVARVAPVLKVDQAAGPDPDALVVYLRAGDIFDPTVKNVNFDYVQAPCAYLRMVIRDSGLHKHPCLEELKALQHPYNVTIHGASAYEDFSFLTKAHHLVLSGVSSFADSAVLLSRSLRTLYTFSWESQLRGHSTGSFVSYHDLPGIDVRRYVAHNYMPYWTREGTAFMLNTTEDNVQALKLFENVPPNHISAQEGVLAMAPSHSLAVVVHACDNHTAAEMLAATLRMMGTDKQAERMPIIVLAEDAQAAAAIKQRLYIAPRKEHDRAGRAEVLAYDLEGMQTVKHQGGNPIDVWGEHLWSRTFGLAIVQPDSHNATMPPSHSCGVPTVGGLRAALGASHATFNVTHLLFVHPGYFHNAAGNHLFGAMQHTHGQRDAMRVMTHGDQPLCVRGDEGEGGGRRLGGCADPYAMLVGVRGGHMPLLHEAGDEEWLTDVCERGKERGACVWGYGELLASGRESVR